MSTKVLGTTKPHLFEDHLLLSFDIKWVEKIGNIPTFLVCIDEKKKLHLISKEKVQVE